MNKVLPFAEIGGTLSFNAINLTASVIGIGAFISTITIIIYTLQQILESAVGVQLYYNVRFYFEYLLQEIKALYQMMISHLRPTSGLEIEKE